MTETEGTLRRSPLDAAHRALVAKMVPFAGWEMPIEYSGTLAEHASVREAVGIFDVSHLGKILVTGEAARALLDKVFSNRFGDLAPGRERYTLILDDEAGIVDDLIVYALGEDRYLLVPNAANVEEVERRVRFRAPAEVTVERLEWATVAVQGPRSREVIGAAYPWAAGLGYMCCAEDGGIVVARSGYTGEVGYEIFAPPEGASKVWDEMLAAARERGGGPCGLGARDTLRLEMGYPLHGNDIDRDTTPREAGLEWAVAAGKPEFVGRRAFIERPVRKTLMGLRMHDRLIPRRGYPVVVGERIIGVVTSGTFSPTIRVGIALVSIEPGAADLGDTVEVDVRGKRGLGLLLRPPMVERSPKG